MLHGDAIARLPYDRRVWAVASIHGEAGRLVALHDRVAPRVRIGDVFVYLGNYIGVGPDPRGAVGELLEFRRWLLARPRAFLCDVVFLRGAQEEMWSKLFQLQFAPNPREVLQWMLDRGVGRSIEAYGGDAEAGLRAAREGPVALTRWAAALRAGVIAASGHTPFFTALKRAAASRRADGTGGLLFVHAGLDPGAPLAAQRDSFWWGSSGFARLDRPFDGFRRIVRGFDPNHGGVVETPLTLSLDMGAGHGGPLMAVALSQDGEIVERVEM